MALINELRQNNPNLRNFTDRQIAASLRRRPEFQQLPEEEFQAQVFGSPEPTPDTDRNSETIGGLFGDAIDAVQRGAYQVAQGAGDFAYEYTGVGRGLGDFGREGAARQIEEMSPRSAEAIQQQIFESTGSGLWDFELGEGANPLTIFLQTASLAGEAVTTGVGAGSLARGVTSFAGRSVGNAARRRAAGAGLDEAGQAAAAQRAARDFAASRTADGIKLGTYGAAETAINTGQIADGAAQEVLGMSDEELDRSEAFAELYWELAEANPEASVSELRQAAREQMASGAKSLVMRDPALLLTTAVLGGYGGKALDDLVTKGTGMGGGRLGAAVRQAAVQGVAETGQGGVGQYAINQGVAEIGADPSRDPMEGVAAAGLSEGFVGGVMGAGAGGLAGRPRKPRAQEQIEAARQQAAAQGGDALDQAQAAQAAEQASEPEREPVDPSVGAEVGNRLQLAMGELDDLQNLARGSSYQGQTRLRNISTILDRAERAFEEGNVGQARRLTERADVIARNLRAALEREGTAERPARPEGELVDEQGVAGLIGRGGRQAQLPPGDPDTIFAGGPTADTTQYDPQARHVRRDEGLAGQREAEARMREQASQQRPQISDQGIVYGQGPVAGNANTGLDRPFADPRFADTAAAQDARTQEPTTTDRLRGDPIDAEWRAFAPESGTRGIPRAEMPQIRAEHRGALANFLSARGIQSRPETVRADSLKPTQREFSEQRVQAAKEREGGDRAILISSDGHVVDGHHQWLAAADQGESVRAIRLDAPIDEVLAEVRDLPSSQTDAGSAQGQTQARDDGLQRRTDGRPFATSRTAMASGYARRAQRQGRRVEAVETNGGYALRIGDVAQQPDLATLPYGGKRWNNETNQAEEMSGESQIVDYSGRRIVVMDVNGVKVPFYQSTGAGGKKETAAGKWYPFTGIGNDGWINKLSGKDLADYYGSPALRQAAERLDATLGDVRKRADIPKTGSTGGGRAFTDTINNLFPGQQATANNERASPRRVQSSIQALRDAVDGRQVASDSNVSPVEPSRGQGASPAESAAQVAESRPESEQATRDDAEPAREPAEGQADAAPASAPGSAQERPGAAGPTPSAADVAMAGGQADILADSPREDAAAEVPRDWGSLAANAQPSDIVSQDDVTQQMRDRTGPFNPEGGIELAPTPAQVGDQVQTLKQARLGRAAEARAITNQVEKRSQLLDDAADMMAKAQTLLNLAGRRRRDDGGSATTAQAEMRAGNEAMGQAKGLYREAVETDAFIQALEHRAKTPIAERQGGIVQGAEAEPAPAESARDAAESPDDSAPKPKRRNKPLSYTGYSGEERQVRSYQEVGDYRIAKVHDGLYEVIDGRDQAISQMAGPNGAAREARRLSDLPTDQRYAIGRSDARPVSREAIIEAIGDTPELSDAKVIQSALELPPQALIGMVLQSVDPRDVRGMYIDGDLYVVADNVESVEDGVRAAIHEAVGHKGIRGVLGDQGHQLDRVMLSLYRSLPNHPTGRDILAEVRRDYPFLDPANREDRITIGEELVAHLLEKGYRPKAWHRAVAKIRDLLRRVFPSIGWTYTDVLALGEQSREWLRREKAMRDAEPVVTRYSKRKGENKLFTPIQQEAEAYRQALDKAMTSLKSRVGPVSLGRTPPVLASLGAPDLPITIMRDVVRKATNGVKHDVEMETIAQLPELLHDPVAVFRSRSEDNALVALVDAMDRNGKPVVVALHLQARESRMVVNRIASAYGDVSGGNKVTSMARDGLLAYVNAKKNPNLVRLVGVQFPGSGSPNQGSQSPERPQSVRLRLPEEGVSQGPNSSVLTPEDIGNPEIRFALRGKQRVAFEQAFDDFTDADRAAASKIGDPTISRSIHQWWQEKTDHWRAKIRQGVVDQYGPLMEQDLALYGDEALTEQITQSAWVKARMAKSANGVAEVLLKNSRIEWNTKEQVFQPKDDDSKGLGAVLGQLGDAAEIHRFLGWIAGNRADKLRAEGRENLFKDADIDAMKSWNRGNLADGRNRDQAYREVFKEFQQYRDDVLAAGEALGVISPEQRAAWRDEFYVPFYRLSEEKGFEAGQLATGGLTRQQAVKKLKGGTGNLNNLLENTMMNFHHIIDAGLKNNAAKQAIENSKRLGVARRVPESHPSATKTFIMEDGKKVFYEIDDPLVYNAVTALVQTGMNSSLMKLMRGFKRVFTNTVTVTPQYIGANLLRDSIQAPATSDLSKNLLGNILVGHRTLKDQKVRAQMLAAGASFSFGHLYGTANTDEVRAGMNRSLRDAKARGVPGSGLPMGAGHVASVVRWGWSKWNDINNHAENLNRAAIYAQNAKEGQQLRAAFEARDLMDFSSHGSWPAVRVLIDIVPFLNARIQGLDKIYRSGVKPGGSVLIDALRGKTPNATDKQLAGRFWAVTGAVSLAMLALYLENRDEEWYQELEEWERDTYTHFNIGNGHFKIPNPFEVGAIGTMMIRTAEQFLDDQATGALFRQRMWHMVTDTFAVGMPQIMQPALDVYANKDSFTGRPIESMSMRNLSPELRQRYGTSAIGSGVSQLLNATLGAIGDPESNPLALSPVQVDHLVQGYLGQVGAWALGMGDTFWRFAQGHEAPDRKWYEFQPIRRFYSNLGDTDPYTRYGTVFYEGLTEARRAYSDVKELREMGRFEAAQERRSEGQRLLALRRGMNRAQRQLGQLNRQITIIQRSNLSGALKRQRIERLQARKTQIQRIWGERVLEARATGT